MTELIKKVTSLLAKWKNHESLFGIIDANLKGNHTGLAIHLMEPKKDSILLE